MKLAAFITWLPVCLGAIAVVQENPSLQTIGLGLWGIGVLAQFTIGIYAISKKLLS